MPARSVVTARQQRLGAELRKLRERAGLTAREAARVMGIAESKISMTEAGRVGVSEERIRYFAGEYACDDSVYVDALVAMGKDQSRGWWTDYRDALPPGFLDLAELEHYATSLRSFENVYIPGLLQIEEQVRAMYAASVAAVSDEQMALRTEFRLRRQEILDTIAYDVVIHEAALRVRIADRTVAKRQLTHILEQSDRPGVSVRVVPFDIDGFIRIGNPMLLVGGAVKQLDTVLLDSAHGGLLLDAEAQLGRYRRMLGEVERAALGTVESRDFIRRVAQQI
ncbi:helix-turn-helix domain-containing protein [Streptomyces sp. NPDC008313]|uniref:helix-turn-helix domain-containing protein n=1 Tax=Streptomyces sp. NPDC008313 TaxID=3364826 RepID=UPI0036E3D673